MVLKKLLVLSILIGCMTVFTNNSHCKITIGVKGNNNQGQNSLSNQKNTTKQDNKKDDKCKKEASATQSIYNKGTGLNSNSNQQKNQLNSKIKPANNANNKKAVITNSPKVTNEKASESVKQKGSINSLQEKIENTNNQIPVQLNYLQKVNDSLKRTNEDLINKFNTVSNNIKILFDRCTNNINQLIQENQQLKNENSLLKSRAKQNFQISGKNLINIQGKKQDDKIDIKAINEDNLDITQSLSETNLKAALQTQNNTTEINASHPSNQNNLPQIQNIEINKPTINVSEPNEKQNIKTNNPMVQNYNQNQQYYTQPIMRSSSKKILDNIQYYPQQNTQYNYQYQQHNSNQYNNNQLNQQYYSNNQNMSQYNNRNSINNNPTAQIQYKQTQYTEINPNTQKQYGQKQYSNNPNQSYKFGNNIYISPTQQIIS